MTQRLDALPFLRAVRVVVVFGVAGAAAVLSGCTTAGIDEAMPSATSSTQSMLPESAPAPTEAQRGTATDPALAPADPGFEAPVETVATPAEPVMSSDGPRNTGTFPNLNIKPGVANTQITDAERAAEMQALRAAQAEQNAAAAGGKATTNPVLLRKLGAQHAKDALKKIEGN
jgi:hypothetical protein